ncbi:L-selectin-like isoform X3 [Salarias fasciatus]|uniref:L-selectin-like isoform X3 n=1 Tax=Salarias fasciatus TaxID=181472 RepID=UPI0011769CA9|nr:L-selectin-like isoform X3 [Salarias fasciatus]
MDEAPFMTLLLTGFLVSTTSSEQEIIFVEQPMAWEKANDYCFQKSWDLVQIRNEETATALKILSEGLTGSAWIGLYENYSSWNWVDGTEPGYINWASGHVMKGTELCASVKDDGTWISSVCTETKTSICYDETSPPPEEKGCAVVSLTNGSWSRQPCINKHPFFCSTELEEKTVEMQKTLVRITIQSSANMADPVLHANLKRQLHSAVSQHTSDKIKMSWYKRPEKVQEKATVKDEC